MSICSSKILVLQAMLSTLQRPGNQFPSAGFSATPVVRMKFGIGVGHSERCKYSLILKKKRRRRKRSHILYTVGQNICTQSWQIKKHFSFHWHLVKTTLLPPSPKDLKTSHLYATDNSISSEGSPFKSQVYTTTRLNQVFWKQITFLAF